LCRWGKTALDNAQDEGATIVVKILQRAQQEFVKPPQLPHEAVADKPLLREESRQKSIQTQISKRIVEDLKSLGSGFKNISEGSMHRGSTSGAFSTGDFKQTVRKVERVDKD
jgi:hypothetical protein